MYLHSDVLPLHVEVSRSEEQFVPDRQGEDHHCLHLTDKETEALHGVRGLSRVVGHVRICAGVSSAFLIAGPASRLGSAGALVGAVCRKSE